MNKFFDALTDEGGSSSGGDDLSFIQQQIQEEEAAIAKLEAQAGTAAPAPSVAPAPVDDSFGATFSRGIDKLPEFASDVATRAGHNLEGLGEMAENIPRAQDILGITPLDIAKKMYRQMVDVPQAPPSRESISKVLHGVGETAAGAALPLAVASGPLGLTGAAAMALLSASGSSMFRSANQALGNDPIKSGTQNLADLAGDTASNTAVGLTAQATPAIARTVYGGKFIDATDPNVIKQVNLAHDLEFLGPKEAETILKTGKISDAQLKTLNQIQETMTTGKGITAALGGFEKRTPRAYAVAEELSKNLEPTANPNSVEATTQNFLRVMKSKDLSVEDGVKYLDTVGDDVMAERGQVVGRLQQAQDTLPKGSQVPIINQDIHTIADNLEAKANDVKFFNQSLSAELQTQADTIRNSLSQQNPILQLSPSMQAQINKSSLGKDSGVTISDLHKRVVEINKEMRELGTFDAGSAGKGLAGDPSAGLMIRDKVSALRELRDQIEPLFYKKAQDIATKANMPSDAIKIKELNQIYSATKPLQQVLRTFSDEIYSSLMPKPTSSLQARPGVNPADAMKLATSPTLAGKASAIARLVGGGGPDAAGVGRANLDLMSKRSNTRIGSAVDLMDLRTAPPLEFGGLQLGNLSSDAAAGIATGAQASNSVQFPRKISVIVQNKDQFLQKVQEVAPEAVPHVQDILEGSYTPQDKSFRLGTLFKMVPELSALLAPSRSGTASEFDGVIQSPEEKSNVATAIEASMMTPREKALGWSKLWKEGKYDGKGVYGN